MKSINWSKSKYLLFLCFFFIFLACDSHENNIVTTGEASECRGDFDYKLDLKNITKLRTERESDKVCYETLKWKYDETNKKIAFSNTNVRLNCCGEREIISYDEADTHILEEIDKSKNGNRCKCMCNYSFFIELSNIEKEDFKLKLLRNVEGSKEDIVLEKTLDLNSLEGSINIEEQSCRE